MCAVLGLPCSLPSRAPAHWRRHRVFRTFDFIFSVLFLLFPNSIQERLYPSYHLTRPPYFDPHPKLQIVKHRPQVGYFCITSPQSPTQKLANVCSYVNIIFFLKKAWFGGRGTGFQYHRTDLRSLVTSFTLDSSPNHHWTLSFSLENNTDIHIF